MVSWESMHVCAGRPQSGGTGAVPHGNFLSKSIDTTEPRQQLVGWHKSRSRSHRAGRREPVCRVTLSGQTRPQRRQY